MRRRPEVVGFRASKMTSEQLRAALERVHGGAGPAQAVGRAFELMKVAEDEIKAAMHRHPEQRKSLWNSFVLLQPGELRWYADELYVAHVRELLGRRVRGEDTRPGTYAEVLVACSQVSLKAPPSEAFAALMERCFLEVFGRLPEGRKAREAWPGELEERLAEARRKTAVPDRIKLPADEREVPAHWREH